MPVAGFLSEIPPLGGIPVMNVILVVIDTLRADHMGCYGYNRPTTPNIDRFAAEGTVFLDMTAPHIPTHPSFTTMFTGRDVIAHNIVTHGGNIPLEPEIPTLAEILSEQGYFTAAADNIGRWFERGFQEYRRYAWEAEKGKPEHKAEAVNNVALPLLEECAGQDQPFFFFVHYWDPHTPYKPPEPYNRMFYDGDEKTKNPGSLDALNATEPFGSWFSSWLEGVSDFDYVVSLYDGAIAYVDSCVQHLFDKVQELGIEEDTLILLTADHGETMDEHGCYFDHHGLYEANLGVPLIARCPGIVPAGQRLEGLVATFDIAPTVLDYAGHVGQVEEQGMFGKSCRELIQHGSHTGNRQYLYVTESTWMRKRGIKTRDWKYIEALQPDFHNLPPVELYDLHEKPVREVTNMVESRPEVVSKLKKLTEDWVKERTTQTGRQDPLMTQGLTLGKQYSE